jgi:putative CocE/NonD family hydrolase
MKVVTEFPHAVREIEHLDVPMPDRCRLAARIWMPESAGDAPVPAILEYLPYRKNDLTLRRDSLNAPYVAGHGYAYVRIDLRGAGDSEGVMPDEYLAQELQDGADAIAWIAAQPWCDGNVGMVGISWGGFNGLQVAALRPPALKAIVTVCSTDDRYADDVHFMGGCLLIDNLAWASQMFWRNSLPPDPRHRPDTWRELWTQRLEGSGLWVRNWLEHQTRDAFWKHGSVCEDFERITVPVYAIGGWADGYCRAVFRLMEGLSGPRKGLVGPWAHAYPHIATPGPAIGFLQETLRWWDHWLKGRDTGIMDEPMLRLFMQDPAPPRTSYASRDGRWVAEPVWPSSNITRTAFALTRAGGLERDRVGAEAALTLRSPLTVGMGAGKWCAYGVPGDLPTDQRAEDGGSLVFETAPLAEALEIAGDPVLELRLSSDRPVAQVAARLMDVLPDGAATRVSYGVLNLTHRDGHERPEPLVPGETYAVRVPLKHVAQRFTSGHRVRLAISSSYFPLIWPAPEAVTLTVHTAGSRLELPVRTASPADADLPEFPAPESAQPLAVEAESTTGSRWHVTHDLIEDRVTMEVVDDPGTFRILDNDLTIAKVGRERYCVGGEDPAGVTGDVDWTVEFSRGAWRIRSVTETSLTSDADNFRVRARLRAWEGDDLVHAQEWEEIIPRQLV